MGSLNPTENGWLRPRQKRDFFFWYTFRSYQNNKLCVKQAVRTASSKFYRWYSEVILTSCAQFPVAFQNVNIHHVTIGSTKRSSAGLFCRIRTLIFMQSFMTFGTSQKALQIFQPVGPSYCLCQSQKRNNNKTNSLNHDLNQKTLRKVLLSTMNKTIFLQFLARKSNTPKSTLKWEIFSSWRLKWKSTLSKALRCSMPFVQIVKIDCTQN